MTIEQQIDLTVQWLKDKVAESHTDGLIIGLSGGIDSSVCAALMVRAVGERALGISMPVKSNPKDQQDAKLLAEAIGIRYYPLDLSAAHQLMFDDITKLVDYRASNERLSDANLRARLRMSALYTIANLKNLLVVGTDNAAELYTGYFTKYGDGGVDILPIANLSKAQVYEWGAYLGVPKAILQREPSAGLWEGQTDEGEMGTTYDYIDAHLRGESIPDKDRQIIETMHARSEHKRHTPPAPPLWE